MKSKNLWFNNLKKEYKQNKRTHDTAIDVWRWETKSRNELQKTKKKIDIVSPLIAWTSELMKEQVKDYARNKSFRDRIGK